MAKINPSADPTSTLVEVPSAKKSIKTITITFDDRDSTLYDRIVKNAEIDERSVSQYTLRALRSAIQQ